MYPRSPGPLEPCPTPQARVRLLEQHDVFVGFLNTRCTLEGACRAAAQSPEIASGTTAPCRRGAARPWIARGRRPSHLPARHSAANCTPELRTRSPAVLQATASAETKDVRKPVDNATRNSEVPPVHERRPIAGSGSAPAPRHFRASGACTLAANDRVDAAVSTMPAALPDPRTTRRLTNGLDPSGDFCFGRPQAQSSSADPVAQQATKQKRRPSDERAAIRPG